MEPGNPAGVCVRNVKVCPGSAFCKRGLQETLELGLEIDKRYHGMPLPSKFKIGVAGCPNKCTDTTTVDLGLVGTSKGFQLYVGGNGGVKPRFAELLVKNLQPSQVLPAVDAVIEYYKETAKPQERMGRMIERLGLEEMRSRVEKAV